MYFSLVKLCKNKINLSETANTVCLLKLLFNDQMYPQST